MQRRLLAAFLCLVATALFLWEWRRTHPPDLALTRLNTERLIIFGIDPSLPPFATIQNDQVVGFDADVAREVGRRLGVAVSFRVLGYDGLFDALRVGEADALISALPFDASRLGDVRYSLPYFDGGVVIVGRADYLAMAALDGKTVAVEQGSLGDDLARVWVRRLKALDKHSFPTASQALDAVYTGQADAALVDLITARQAVRAQPGLHYAVPTVQPEPYLIVTRIGSRELLELINKALDEMARDGTLAALVARWL